MTKHPTLAFPNRRFLLWCFIQSTYERTQLFFRQTNVDINKNKRMRVTTITALAVVGSSSTPVRQKLKNVTCIELEPWSRFLLLLRPNRFLSKKHSFHAAAKHTHIRSWNSTTKRNKTNAPRWLFQIIVSYDGASSSQRMNAYCILVSFTGVLRSVYFWGRYTIAFLQSDHFHFSRNF